LKPFETIDSSEPTFRLLELPAYADSFQDLYEELEGEVISLDLDDLDDPDDPS
jgi:hypothetical protein